MRFAGNVQTEMPKYGNSRRHALDKLRELESLLKPNKSAFFSASSIFFEVASSNHCSLHESQTNAGNLPTLFP